MREIDENIKNIIKKMEVLRENNIQLKSNNNITLKIIGFACLDVALGFGER